MTSDNGTWRVLSSTVRGPGKNTNQDSVRHEWASADHRSFVLAVADGHGSAAHPRSDVGSRFAVEAFVQNALGLLRSLTRQRGRGDLDLDRLDHWVKREIPRNVVWGWRERVERDLKDDPPPRDADWRPGTEPYGSTLIGAAVTEDVLMAWQLGDGDLCVVDEDGTSRVLLNDVAKLGDETDSLCSSNAHHLVKCHWELRGGRTPSVIALSTDGLSNSFVEFDGYLEFVHDVRRRLDHSFARVRGALPGWLEQASSFSGDDTTFLAAWWEAADTRRRHEDEPTPVSAAAPGEQGRHDEEETHGGHAE